VSDWSNKERNTTDSRVKADQIGRKVVRFMVNVPGQGPSPWIGSPLFGRYDKDPGRYRPQYYHVEIDVPVTVGGIGRGSIPINNEPFCMTRMTHRIIGPTADPTTSGLYQDGQYDIEWKDEQRNYVDGPINANIMWGWDESGYVMDLPFPLPFVGNKTLSFTVVNRVLRVLVPTADYFAIQICLAGIADLGELERR